MSEREQMMLILATMRDDIEFRSSRCCSQEEQNEIENERVRVGELRTRLVAELQPFLDDYFTN